MSIERIRPLVPVVLALLAGCAKKDEAPAPAPAPTPAAAVAPNVITVVAGDYSFQAPDTIPAGLTTIRLVNEGKELHHLIVMNTYSHRQLSVS